MPFAQYFTGGMKRLRHRRQTGLTPTLVSHASCICHNWQLLGNLVHLVMLSEGLVTLLSYHRSSFRASSVQQMPLVSVMCCGDTIIRTIGLKCHVPHVPELHGHSEDMRL